MNRISSKVYNISSEICESSITLNYINKKLKTIEICSSSSKGKILSCVIPKESIPSEFSGTYKQYLIFCINAKIRKHNSILG